MLTPPASFYIDPDRLRRERDEVFARSWQLVGRVEQLAQPGDYFTTQLGNEPLLFTNDNGTLRGFFNVCRHRAGPIAYGCGRASACRRYHGWCTVIRTIAATEMEGAVDSIPRAFLQSIAVSSSRCYLRARSATPAFDVFIP
jgi:choline monooxygenase